MLSPSAALHTRGRTLNLVMGCLAASFFCTASAMEVAASGEERAMSAISSRRYTGGVQWQHRRGSKSTAVQKQQQKRKTINRKKHPL